MAVSLVCEREFWRFCPPLNQSAAPALEGAIAKAITTADEIIRARRDNGRRPIIGPPFCRDTSASDRPEKRSGGQTAAVPTLPSGDSRCQPTDTNNLTR